MIKTVTKDDLIELGFAPGTARKIILICTLANRKHWLINLMIYFKMEKIGNSTKTEKKRQGPKTLSFLLYRRPGSNRHVLADTGF